ncbi:MAG TPA: antibiotic biosynthesis monooxygenase [Crinalium sp.]|jgi:heme-degrading monooxygenase HmoA
MSSDFHDHLKRQLVHVAIGEFKPGRFSEAQRLYEQAVATYHEGFKGAYLLQEPGTDRGISVIFWDSVDEMDANQAQEQHRAILRKMTPLFVHLPTTAIYEVVSEIAPSSNAESLLAGHR